MGLDPYQPGELRLLLLPADRLTAEACIPATDCPVNFFASQVLPCSRYSALVILCCSSAVLLFPSATPPCQAYLIGLYDVH